MRYRAGIVEDFIQRRFRLYVARDEQPGFQSLLMEDGTWQTVDHAVVPPEQAGILLPLDAIDAVLDAFKRFKGDALDSSTEAKILREWRQAESDRVTDLTFTLTGLLEQVLSPTTQPPSSDSGMEE